MLLYIFISGFIQRLISTVKHSAQVVLAKLVQIDRLDHPHFPNLTWAHMIKPATLLCFYTVFLLLQLLKGLVQPKMKIMSLMTHPHVVPSP